MEETQAPEAEDHLGMTDAQWAQWQIFTNSYGEQDENGIDISLIRENLRVSPGLPFFWDARTLKNSRNITLRTDLGSVDLLGEVAGVASFEQLWEGATVLDLEGLPVRVASIPALIAMKQAADRPKDRLHLMELEQMQAQKEAAEKEASQV